VLLLIQGVEWECNTSDSDAYQKAAIALASSLLLHEQFNLQRQWKDGDRRFRWTG
jgi:hypothetical protein